MNLVWSWQDFRGHFIILHQPLDCTDFFSITSGGYKHFWPQNLINVSYTLQLFLEFAKATFSSHCSSFIHHYFIYRAFRILSKFPHLPPNTVLSPFARKNILVVFLSLPFCCSKGSKYLIPCCSKNCNSETWTPENHTFLFFSLNSG